MKNNKKRCGQEKAALINRTIQTQTLQLYTCYMHLKTFCCPIFYKGELIGLFYGGAVRCNKFQFTFSDVPVISDQKFTSITNLLISILNLLSIDKAEQTKPKAKGSYAILRKKLTRREYDVAELICKGLTNKEISVELHISEKTVKSHVSNILKKLQMKDRMQILLFVNKI